MDPLTIGLLSGGSSLLGGLLSGQKSPDWGSIGSKYLNQLGGAYSNQFMGNYGRLSGLTMGQENAPDYASSALAAFQRSPAYAGMLSNMTNAANAASSSARGNASAGLNFGVGQAGYNLGNPGTMVNNFLSNAMLQQYMQGQGQFGQLAGLRLQGANQMSQGGAQLAGQAMGQYQQSPSFWNRLGGGLMGLGNAGMQYAMLQQPGMQGGGWGQSTSQTAAYPWRSPMGPQP